jgi:hypothetical protein
MIFAIAISFEIRKPYCDLMLLKIADGLLRIMANGRQNFRISLHHKKE